MSRGPAPAAALCAVGATLLLLADGRTWSTGRVVPPPPLPPVLHSVTGGGYLPELHGLGLLALAGVGGLFAARGLLRRAMGAVLAAAGTLAATRCLALLVAGATGRPPPAVGWPIVAIVGGIAVAVGGSWVVARGGQWSTLAARYDGPAGAGRPPATAGEEPTGQVVWDALDRGEDPTAGRSERPFEALPAVVPLPAATLDG